MQRTFLIIAATLLVSAASGCLHRNIQPTDGQHACNGACGGLLGGLVASPNAQAMHARHAAAQDVGPAGPPTAAYGYPYYTLRGPRDFLASDPPSIGN